MNLSEYQRQAADFAIYPNRYNNPTYPVLGLTGEAGEIANKVKKLQRDGLYLDDIWEDIHAELGDVLWYLAALADEFGMDLDIVAEQNLDKLRSRKARNAIGGSGDYR